MLPKPIIEILRQFDQLLKQVKALNNKEFFKIKNDIKFLELWRDEIEAQKQSIFIIGKYSTGKSTFHNFILDNTEKNNELFKTATSTETASIQTLEHCRGIENACAEIVFKDRTELKKTKLPEELQTKFLNDSIHFPLNDPKKIKFFREQVISKKGKIGDEDLKDKIERINIKFPLKYLRYYKLIDTPGLDAADLKKDDSEINKIGDEDVKAHLFAKSYIFWFIDGSNRELSGDLKLINKEKELINNNIDRICFFINKFDENLIQDEITTVKAKEERKNELLKKLNNELDKIVGSKFSRTVYFTSFKNPRKKFPDQSTYDIIEAVEDSILNLEKQTNYNNIHSLIELLSKILADVKNNLVQNKIHSVRKELKKLDRRREELNKLKKKSFNIADDTRQVINKAKDFTKNFKKDYNFEKYLKKEVNSRKKFNYTIKEFKKSLQGSCSKIQNSSDRIRRWELKLDNYTNKLNQIREVRLFSFREEESFWRKHIYDPELKEKKKDLNHYVSEKIQAFDSLIRILERDIELEFGIKLKEIEDAIIVEQKLINEYNEQLNSINDTEKKIKNLDVLLLKEIERNISEWKHDESGDDLKNFLSLYSLLQEHNIVEHNNLQNG